MSVKPISSAFAISPNRFGWEVFKTRQDDKLEFKLHFDTPLNLVEQLPSYFICPKEKGELAVFIGKLESHRQILEALHQDYQEFIQTVHLPEGFSANVTGTRLTLVQTELGWELTKGDRFYSHCGVLANMLANIPHLYAQSLWDERDDFFDIVKLSYEKSIAFLNSVTVQLERASA